MRGSSFDCCTMSSKHEHANMFDSTNMKVYSIIAVVYYCCFFV
jgi:hypothetical protein